MAKIATTSATINLFLLLITLLASTLNLVDAQKTWCVAKPSSDEKVLLENINYACSYVDCKILQSDSCSSPNYLINRASIAMNLYYQGMGRNKWNCDFKNSGLITVNDPSYGSCAYK